jgi:heme/copper-type cytochrome/quinol oxidase subunit 3
MSGITVKIGQNNLNNNKKRENIILYILLTVILGAVFVMIQYIEFKSSKFTILFMT